MKRLNILVEGQTEENFVRDVLAEHLANFGVVVTQRRFITGKTRPASKTGKRQNILHKGGITSYQQVVNDLNRWRNENRRATLT